MNLLNLQCIYYKAALREFRHNRWSSAPQELMACLPESNTKALRHLCSGDVSLAHGDLFMFKGGSFMFKGKWSWVSRVSTHAGFLRPLWTDSPSAHDAPTRRPRGAHETPTTRPRRAHDAPTRRPRGAHEAPTRRPRHLLHFMCVSIKNYGNYWNPKEIAANTSIVCRFAPWDPVQPEIAANTALSSRNTQVIPILSI